MTIVSRKLNTSKYSCATKDRRWMLQLLLSNMPLNLQDRDLKLQKFQQEDSRYFALCFTLGVLFPYKSLQLYGWIFPCFHVPSDCAGLCSGLSMQVGGTGLTVTGANRVILVDPAWNPSADAQAIDRVHRIGQKQEAGFMLSYPGMAWGFWRPWKTCTFCTCWHFQFRKNCWQVVVYRLIGSGAIEDKMFRLQIFKGGLSKTFMEHEQQVRFFTHKQLQPESLCFCGILAKMEELRRILDTWGWSLSLSSRISAPSWFSNFFLPFKSDKYYWIYFAMSELGI